MNQKIFEIERPHPKLLRLYIIRNFLLIFIAGPAVFLSAPIAYFRYKTMRYRFDEEGISMSWGLLFRREINLTYSRIQDIHLSSGVLQRWLGLADIQIQTASGSAAAEMTLEGLLEFEEVRDFLYQRMRGNRAAIASPSTSSQGSISQEDQTQLIKTLKEVQHELRATREAVEKLHSKQEG